jgi:SET domain-containing protein
MALIDQTHYIFVIELKNQKVFMTYKLNWTTDKIVVQPDQHRGVGNFAIRSIQSNETITVFGGYVFTLETYHFLPAQLKHFCYQVHHDPVLLYGPVETDQISDGDFFNHSCSPNAGFQTSIHLVAMRDIAPGEEVTFDYAMCMTNDFGNMECECGSTNCRGYISGNDWKIQSLQRAYRGYFQPYIENLIQRSS